MCSHTQVDTEDVQPHESGQTRYLATQKWPHKMCSNTKVDRRDVQPHTSGQTRRVSQTKDRRRVTHIGKNNNVTGGWHIVIQIKAMKTDYFSCGDSALLFLDVLYFTFLTWLHFQLINKIASFFFFFPLFAKLYFTANFVLMVNR